MESDQAKEIANDSPEQQSITAEKLVSTDIEQAHSTKDNSGDQPVASPNDQSPQPSTTQEDTTLPQYSYFSNQLPVIVPQATTRGNAPDGMQRVLQKICQDYILNELPRKTPREMTRLFKDVVLLSSSIQQYLTPELFSEAKDKVLPSLQGDHKTMLQDARVDDEIVKKRFEERDAVSRAFEDAMAELRNDYDDVDASKGFPSELPDIFKRYEQLTTRRSNRLHGSTYGRSPGGKHRGSRGGFHPYRHAPYHHNVAASAPPRFRDGYGRNVPRDRRDKDDHVIRRRGDGRRDHHRGAPAVAGGHDDQRTARPFAGSPQQKGFDDRLRNHPRASEQQQDTRFTSRAPRPLMPVVGSTTTTNPYPAQASANPSVPVYEAPPKPSMAPAQPANYSYTASNTVAPYTTEGAAAAATYDPSAPYYMQQDPTAMSAYNAQIYGQAYAPQAPMVQPQQWNAYAAPISMQSFSSRDHGRHTSLPLPADFLSGPSDAPRISMPEPHQSLGVIKGVIIRDAQGNIGLTSYTFSPFTYT